VTPCVSASRELAEPLAATAATARTWLLLEQPGPWGAKAFTSSRLEPELGRALESRADGTDVRLALIRQPGRDEGGLSAPRRRVFLAHTVPGASWIREVPVADPRELLDFDFAALGRGEHESFGSVYDGPPLALVCTNGKRDRCCAVLGRPLAAELAASGHGQVWEVTHLGGHRFSPTMLVLPYGYAYGRLDPGTAKEVLDATHKRRMMLPGCRGRSSWQRPGQAAELAVRELIGEEIADAIAVCPAVERGSGCWTMDVTHTDGRAWTVTVEQRWPGPPRPESCGAALGAPARMVVSSVRRLSSAYSETTDAQANLDLGVRACVVMLPQRLSRWVRPGSSWC
jgi:hypothetical protein